MTILNFNPISKDRSKICQNTYSCSTDITKLLNDSACLFYTLMFTCVRRTYSPTHIALIIDKRKFKTTLCPISDHFICINFTNIFERNYNSKTFLTSFTYK